MGTIGAKKNLLPEKDALPGDAVEK